MQVDQPSASWPVIGVYSLEDLVTSSSVVLFVVSADLCHTGTSPGYSPALERWEWGTFLNVA